MVDLDSLKRMYTACDLYVVSSRYEGGPQAVLEASSMKVPIVSTNVGMASEVLSEGCIINLEDEAYIPTQDDIEYNFKNVQKFGLYVHMEKYEEFFRSTLT